MTPTTLRHLPASDAATLPPLLQALWQDAHNDWAAAHTLAQDIDTPAAARIHAYLHPKEGDTSNANYWYRRAGHPPQTGPLEAEWTAIAADLLAAP